MTPKNVPPAVTPRVEDWPEVCVDEGPKVPVAGFMVQSRYEPAEREVGLRFSPLA